MRTPFFGAHAVTRSPNFADCKCINLFPELADPKGSGKDTGALYMCPGLDLLATAGAGPIRGANVMAGVLYVVSGNTLYSVSQTYAIASLGTIGTYVGPASIINNGTQLVLVDGQAGYLWNGSAFSTLSLPYANPVTATFQDGFGVISYAGINSISQSNLNDLSTWSALNYATISGRPDNVMAVADIHVELWIVKQTNTEVWINAGLSQFVFQRLQGVFIETGTNAPFSVARAGETLIWLSQNDQGERVVVQSQGYKMVRISTHAVEYALAQCSTVADAQAYVYQQEGHVFYVLTLPGGNQTWAYDLATGLWHQRAAFSNGAFGRHWGNAFAAFGDRSVVGDYQSGNLYAFDMGTATDNGAQRKWVRSWRALPQPSEQPVRFGSLRIDMMTGIGVPAGAAPNVALKWSDDGGNTWSQPRIQPAGPIGKTAQRVKFNALGSTRRNHGLDRIFHLESSDPFAVALIGAELQP